MKEKKIIDYYCTGCGLCKRNQKKDFVMVSGFNHPKLEKKDIDFCKIVCPCFDTLSKTYENKNVWGYYIDSWLGHSSDADIRFQASSGGCITSIAIFLLENKYVDGILHSVKNPEKPWQTITVCSTSSKELKERCGSRYAQSSPLLDIEDLLEPNKRYAFIGKPCDIYSLKKYQEINEKIKQQIIITLSFFCAGQPSENANIKLINELLNTDYRNCKYLSYRGHGWPGKAYAEGYDGAFGEMNYESSWGKILGRDIRNVCKYCMIGTGEYADISCGDAWYLTEDNEPSFVEKPGRNIIFGRTDNGISIIKKAAESGYIEIENFSDSIELLKYMQPSHYDKKNSMISKVLGMRIFFKPVPRYDFKVLFILAKNSNISRLYEVFRGTIGRIVRRKL